MAHPRYLLIMFGGCLLAACGSSSSSRDSTTTSSGAGAGSSSAGAGGAGGTGGATGSGGTSGVGGGCATTPTFAEVLSKPLSSCSGHEPHCHDLAAGMLHIDPTDPVMTWGALVDVPAASPGGGTRVVPGDPAHSFLYRKVIDDLGPDDGDPMPKTGLATGWSQLPADELELMRCWILGGAPEN